MEKNLEIKDLEFVMGRSKDGEISRININGFMQKIKDIIWDVLFYKFDTFYKIENPNNVFFKEGEESEIFGTTEEDNFIKTLLSKIFNLHIGKGGFDVTPREPRFIKIAERKVLFSLRIEGWRREEEELHVRYPLFPCIWPPLGAGWKVLTENSFCFDESGDFNFEKFKKDLQSPIFKALSKNWEMAIFAMDFFDKLAAINSKNKE